jgi:uncharacterized protein YdeI (YjbR/CyaY-like superfamily)
MAYDKELAERVRKALAARKAEKKDVKEKLMFGGLSFMIGGHMAVGVEEARLMVRLSQDEGTRRLRDPYVSPMDVTGTAMRGFVYVALPGVQTPAAVRKWVDRALAHVETLKPRKKKKPAAKGGSRKKSKGAKAAGTAEPTFFESAVAFRKWLAAHHLTAKELLVGFHKRSTGKPSMRWPESVDEALSFGWIDGVRRRVDEERYSIRFSPRRPTSVWSSVNIKRARALIAAGRMRPAGQVAFDRRDAKKSAIYAYEQVKRATFTVAQRKRFRDEAAAWTFFQEQAPNYRQRFTHWVTSAKLEATREARLEKLIAACAAGRVL